MSETEIVHNPYEGVDWSTVGQYKTEFHTHARGKVDTNQGVVDLYAGDGTDGDGNYLADGDEYDIIGFSDQNTWPWTDFDRDPEEMGVVAIPALETRDGEHIHSLTTTIPHDEINQDTRMDQLQDILTTDEYFHPDPMAVYAHPASYVDDPDNWDRYEEEYEAFSRADGLLGLEILGKWFTSGEDHHDWRTNRDIWDNLLVHFAPDRMVWGWTGGDPRDDYDIGGIVDRVYNSVLLDPSEFDPSDQEGSRQNIVDAMKSGKILFHGRDEWDPETEDPPSVPEVNSIDVDGLTITIDADGWETIDWISRGNVVETGPSIDVTSGHAPYVRAELHSNPSETTYTQPFGIEGDRLMSIDTNATLSIESGGTLSIDTS